MRNYTDEQRAQIMQYRDKIFRATAIGDKAQAKELEARLFSLKQGFKKQNTQ